MNFIKRGFTLVEMMIVIVIVGFLITVLFRTYAKISEISARVENTKNVYTQLGFLQNYINSFVNGTKLNYSIYTGKTAKRLSDNGWTDEINLIGKNSMKIYITGDCFDYTGNNKLFSQNILQKKCWIELNNNGEKTFLTDPNKVYISNFYFQLLPQKYYTGNVLDYFDNSKYWESQGFWMFGQIWVKNWNENRVSNIHNTFQYFFGL